MPAESRAKYLAIAGWSLVGAAGLIVLFLVYQLFVTDFINSRSQSVASDELVTSLADRRGNLQSGGTSTSQAGAEPEAELLVEPEVAVGEPFARLVIDRIGLDAILFEGVDRSTLKLGPGHMPGTPLPGQPGNAVLSGHRTTYGRPFFDLDQLVSGDEIQVETALGISTYAVRDILIVEPTDVWVADHIDGAWLTLTTCNPRFSAAQRLVIQAELVDGPNLEFVEAA
jgi:sortase A